MSTSDATDDFGHRQIDLFQIFGHDARLLTCAEDFSLRDHSFGGAVETVTMAIRTVYDTFSHNGFASLADLVTVSRGGNFPGFFRAFLQSHTI